MLSKSQEERLESLQRKALRIILGFDLNYVELLEKAGITSLKERRINAARKFANKLVNSDRFGHYFPINNSERQGMRSRRRYREENARTLRLFNSPLFYFRRALNGRTSR